MHEKKSFFKYEEKRQTFLPGVLNYDGNSNLMTCTVVLVCQGFSRLRTYNGQTLIETRSQYLFCELSIIGLFCLKPSDYAKSWTNWTLGKVCQ